MDSGMPKKSWFLRGYDTFRGIGRKIMRVGRLFPYAMPGWVDEAANFLHDKYIKDNRAHELHRAEAGREQSVKSGLDTKGGAEDPNLKYRIRN
jgi:hypothetical protein